MNELSSPHIQIPPISPTVIYEKILPFLSASVNLYLAIKQNKRMNEHVGILQKKLCIFTKVYFSNTLYLTSKIVYTMPEMNQIIV